MSKSKFFIEKILTSVIAFVTIVTFSAKKTSIALSNGETNTEEVIQESSEKKIKGKDVEVEEITESSASNLKKLIKLIKKIDNATRENNLGVSNSENNSRKQKHRNK